MTDITLKVEADSPAESVQIGVGDTLNLKLPGRGTSGYAWSAKSDAPGLVVESTGRSHDPSAGGAIGASAVENFAVFPRAPGNYTVDLELKRPWEAEPSQTKTVNVKVR